MFQLYKISDELFMLTGITTSELDAIERVICTVPDVLQNNNGEDVYLVQFYEKFVSTGMFAKMNCQGFFLIWWEISQKNKFI